MQDPAKLMERYGKVFKTLERAPTPVVQLLPYMSRIMAQGFSPEEAAQSLAIMSEAMPGEEETGVENALKAFREVQLKGRGAELGLKEGMTPMQMIEAGSRRLSERQAAGENLNAMLKEYDMADPRERKGVLGFITRGIEAEGFKRVRGYAAETPADFMQKSIAEYQKSEPGKYAQIEADTALARAQRGALAARAETLRKEAAKQLETEGRFEQADPATVAADLARGAIGKVTGKTVAESLIEERAVKIARERAGLRPGEGPAGVSVSGMETSKVVEIALEKLIEMADLKGTKQPGSVAEGLSKLIQIEEEKRRERRDRTSPPLSAPPPQYWDARM
jgi:hypothetical protein